MTTPTIDLNLSADDIGVGLTLKTKDGKIITLDAFSVKDAEPEVARVRLDDVKIGDKFETRDGQTFTVKELDHTDDTLLAQPGNGLSLWFRFNGYCPGFGDRLDAINLVKAPISLKDMKIGQKARTRGGDVVTLDRLHPDAGAFWQYWFTKGDGGRLSYTVNGSYCSRDIPDERDIVEILAPCVSIKDAKKGDTFVLRNGEKWVHTGETDSFGHGGSRGGSRRLWFFFSGHCPGADEDHDVVELIPAPKPTLADRISAALERNDAKIDRIDRIVVSFEDWKVFTGKSSGDHNTSYFLGVPLWYSTAYEKDEFAAVFAAD